MAPALPARFTVSDGGKLRDGPIIRSDGSGPTTTNRLKRQDARISYKYGKRLESFCFACVTYFNRLFLGTFFSFLVLSFSDHEIDSLLHHIAREPCNHYVALTQRGVNQPWLITAVTTFMVLFQSPALRRLADGRSASD